MTITRADFDHAANAACAELGEEAFKAARAEGHAVPLRVIISEAIGEYG